MGHGAVLALACVLSPGPAGSAAASSWRALFASSGPRSVEFWSVALDGSDRRPLATHEAFTNDGPAYRTILDAAGPVLMDAAASPDGRWWAYRLDASPAKDGALWLAHLESRQVRLVAANVEQIAWSSTRAQLLYPLAPPPRSPMVERGMVMEGRAWRLHDAESGSDAVVAGPERTFTYAGPWTEPDRLLFWRVSFGVVDELFAFDMASGAARKRHTLLREHILHFGPRGPAAGWALVATDIEHRCSRAWVVDRDGRVGRPVLDGCSYVCASRGACVAFRDERTLVVARSEGPTGRFVSWWQGHPVSLVTRDLRTGREARLLDGTPGLAWTLVGSRSGEVMLVRRCLSSSAWIAGRDRECRVETRAFDGRLVGTLHRGDDPPAFLGFVR